MFALGFKSWAVKALIKTTLEQHQIAYDISPYRGRAGWVYVFGCWRHESKTATIEAIVAVGFRLGLIPKLNKRKLGEVNNLRSSQKYRGDHQEAVRRQSEAIPEIF